MKLEEDWKEELGIRTTEDEEGERGVSWALAGRGAELRNDMPPPCWAALWICTISAQGDYPVCFLPSPPLPSPPHVLVYFLGWWAGLFLLRWFFLIGIVFPIFPLWSILLERYFIVSVQQFSLTKNLYWKCWRGSLGTVNLGWSASLLKSTSQGTEIGRDSREQQMGIPKAAWLLASQDFIRCVSPEIPFEMARPPHPFWDEDHVTWKDWI